MKEEFHWCQYDFIDQMMKFAKLDGNNLTPAKVLDVGCGIGGYVAKVRSGSGEKPS